MRVKDEQNKNTLEKTNCKNHELLYFSSKSQAIIVIANHSEDSCKSSDDLTRLDFLIKKIVGNTQERRAMSGQRDAVACNLLLVIMP